MSVWNIFSGIFFNAVLTELSIFSKGLLEGILNIKSISFLIPTIIIL